MQIMITGDVITTSAQCYNKGDILFVFFIDWNFNLTEVLKSQGRDYHNGFQKKLLYDSSFIRSYKPFLDQNFLSEYISKPINQH